MTDYNFVTVDVQITTPGNNPLPQGNIIFVPSDFVWDTSTGEIVFVPPVEFATDGSYSGGVIQVPLLAMDNATLNTTWAWLFTGSVPGVQVPVHKLTVNFATGPEQKLTDLLSASTILLP